MRQFSRITGFLALFILFHSNAFCEVVGISVHSDLQGSSPDKLSSCISKSLEDIRGHYIKTLKDHGPSSKLNGAKVGKNELLDVLYHITLHEKEGKTGIKVLQYNVALGKVTNVVVSYLGEYRRPCDLAVVETLDLLDKEPTFINRAKPYINKGRVFASAGRWDEAVKEYTMAAKILTNSGAIYRDMALFLERAGDEGWSIAWYESAIKTDPLEIPSYLGIARVENGRENIETALAVLEKAVEVAPKPPMLFYELGKLYRLLERYELAWPAFLKAIERDSSDDALNIDLVDALVKDKKWALASKYQMEYLKRHPTDSDARGKLLNYYFKAENYGAAAQILESFLKAYPDAIVWVEQYAIALEGLNELDKAKQQYEKLIRLGHENYKTHLALGRIAYKKGDFKGAKSHIKWTLGKGYNDIEALRMLSNIQVMEKNHIGALETYKKILFYEEGLRDSDLTQLFVLGEKAQAMWMVEDILNDAMAFHYGNDRRKLLMSLVEVKIRDGRKEEAVSWLKGNSRYIKRYGPAYMLWGSLLIDMGRYDEAESVFYIGLQNTTESSFPLNVAQLYHKIKRFSKAEDFYRHALGINAGSFKVLLQYMEVCLINGSLDAALWTFHDLAQIELPPLYKIYFAFLQVMYGKLKGEELFAKQATGYVVALVETYGLSGKLDFSDFDPVIEMNFEGKERELIEELVLLVEGKMAPAKFRKRHSMEK